MRFYNRMIDIERIVKKRGGKVLNYFSNDGLHAKVECSCGNIWNVRLRDLRRDRWCLDCRVPGSKAQRKLIKILKDIFIGFDIKREYQDFDWLKTKKGGKQRIDIFISNDDETFTLAVEYDGRQHEMPCRFGGISEKAAKTAFLRTVELDNLKDEKIKNHPEDVKYFIRFSYKDEYNSLAAVTGKLIEAGIPMPQ